MYKLSPIFIKTYCPTEMKKIVSGLFIALKKENEGDFIKINLYSSEVLYTDVLLKYS